MKLLLFILIPAALLAGCAGGLFDVKDDTVFQQTIPVCQTDDECEKVWAAARQWVMKTTHQGLAVDTREVIKTNPSDEDAINRELDITINKVALDDDKYQIVIDIWCNTTINRCSYEREMMRQFNKDMASYVSSDQSQEILRIFTDDDDMNALFSSYASSLNEADLQRHAQKYFLPATVVSGENVRQLVSTDDVIAFIKESRKRIGDKKITRIEAKNQKILTSTETTAIVKMQWGFYDASDVLQLTQKVTYNLIKVGKGWKIMSVSFNN